jgi:hypothetical protein
MPLSQKSTSLIVSHSGDGDYTRIGDALAKATPGTCLMIRPGIDQECLAFKKPVTLSGDGPSSRVTLESRGGSCLRIETDESVLVRNLNLDCRAGQDMVRCPAVAVQKGSLTLEHCRISCDSLSCLQVRGSDARLLAQHCQIYGSDTGITVAEQSHATVENCDIFGHNLAGMVLSGGSKAVVRQTRIRHGEGYGMEVKEGSTARLEECQVYSNEKAALRVERGSQLLLVSCKIRGEGVFRSLARSVAIGMGSGMLVAGGGVMAGRPFKGLYLLVFLLPVAVAVGLVAGVVSALRSMRRKVIEGELTEATAFSSSRLEEARDPESN